MGGSMVMLVIAAAVLLMLAAMVWALVDIARNVRPMGNTALWVALIVLIPLAGPILWFTVGRSDGIPL